MDFSCNGVKLGELMSMEAVIMTHVMEGSCAVGHALEFLFINLLRLHIEVVDLITFGSLRRNLNLQNLLSIYYPYMFSIIINQRNITRYYNTFEKDYGVISTVWLGTLHCSIQVVRNSRENFRDVFGIALLQFVLEVTEDLVVLKWC